MINDTILKRLNSLNYKPTSLNRLTCFSSSILDLPMLVGEFLGCLGEGAEPVVQRVVVGVLRRGVVVVVDVVEPV